jgi:hypothetical protein
VFPGFFSTELLLYCVTFSKIQCCILQSQVQRCCSVEFGIFLGLLASRKTGSYFSASLNDTVFTHILFAHILLHSFCILKLDIYTRNRRAKYMTPTPSELDVLLVWKKPRQNWEILNRTFSKCDARASPVRLLSKRGKNYRTHVLYNCVGSITHMSRGYSTHDFKFQYLDNLFWYVYYIIVSSEKWDRTELYKTQSYIIFPVSKPSSDF